MMEELKKIPQIGKFLLRKEFDTINKISLQKIINNFFSKLKDGAKKGLAINQSQDEMAKEVLEMLDNIAENSLKPIVNATGVVLHTNLGRAPIDKEIIGEAEKIAGYSNLEFDLKTGKRGERYSHLGEKLSFLLGCEDAIVVNNNAAAVFLVLNTFSKNKNTLVSRGELVEIGGSFRVPDVMRESGALLKEIGTTNKTKISDYENGIDENTAILMKVHKSNFSIVGFCEETDFLDITALAAKKGLVDYFDVGSLALKKYDFIGDEPSAEEIFSNNPSLVSFSGDKLFGSVQAGIIAGKKELIEKIKKNQLLRMLRVDKFTLAILEATVSRYIVSGEKKIKTLRLLSKTKEQMHKEAATLLYLLGNNPIFKIKEGETFVGGGSLPGHKIPTVCIIVEDQAKKAEANLKALREYGIIGRIESDAVVIDLKSVDEDELQIIAEGLNKIFGTRQ
mgnify:FL=1